MNVTPPPSQTPASQGPDAVRGTDLLLLSYIAYLLGAITGGAGSLVGLIVAYMQRDEVAGTWRESHYNWLIRTFWIGLLFVVIGGITTWILIGFLILFATFIWYIVRLVKGWMAYSKEEPIADPDNWFFG